MPDEVEVTPTDLWNFMRESVDLFNAMPLAPVKAFPEATVRVTDRKFESTITVTGTKLPEKALLPIKQVYDVVRPEEEPAVVPPVGCCLYPWPGLSGVLYPSSDLPATLRLEFNLVDPGVFYAGTLVSAYRYEFDISGSLWYIDIADALGDYWSFQDDGMPPTEYASSVCLVTGTESNWGSVGITIYDDFPDELTVSFIYDGTPYEYTLTRISLCNWQFTNEPTDPFVIALYYDDTTYNWNLLFSYLGEVLGSTNKDAPQSSPDGTFPDLSGLSSIVVAP